MNSSLEALRGKWAIHWTPHVVAIPSATLSVPLSENKFGELFLPWTMASFLAYLALLLVLALAWFFVYRKYRPPFWVLPIVGAVAGAIKGYLTGVFGGLFTTISVIGPDPIQRSLTSALIWAISVPAVAVVMARLGGFFSDRKALINYLVDELGPTKSVRPNELSLAPGSVLSEKFRSTASSESDYLEIASQLRQAAQEQVRPLSHKLWKQQLKRKSRFSVWEVTRLAVVDNGFNLRFNLLIIIPLMAMVNFREYEFGYAFGFVSFGVSLISLSLILAQRLSQRINGTVLYVAAVVFSSGIISVVATYFTYRDLGQAWGLVYLGNFLLFSVFLFTTMLFVGGIQNSIRKSDEILDQLRKEVGRASFLKEISRRTQEQQDEKLAKFLHGHVQSRMMALALEIERALADENLTLAKQAAAQASNLLQNPLSGLQLETKNNLDSLVKDLIQSWSGLMTITFTGKLDNPDQMLVESVWQIISEAVSNASKHGLADAVEIELMETDTLVKLKISDNGIGPTQGESGMGSSLIDAYSQGNWSLDFGASGIGSTLSATIAKN